MTTKAGTTVPEPVPTPATPAARPAPWVRTRLRATPLAALLMAALALVTAFLAAAFPRLSDRGADAALREFTHNLGVNATSFSATGATLSDDTAGQLDTARDRLTREIGRQIPLSPVGEVYGTRVKRDHGLFNRGLTRLSDSTPPMLDLLYVHGLRDKVTLTAGTWPGVTAGGAPLPIAISEKAAEAIGIKLGDVLDNGEDGVGPVRTSVVGLYRVNDSQDPFWEDLGCPSRACLAGGPDTLHWRTTGFVGGESLGALSNWGSVGQNFWRVPIETGALRVDQLDHTRDIVNSFIAGRGASALPALTNRPEMHVNSMLPEVFTRATVRYQAAAPLGAIGPAGVAGVAAVVLCLAAALTADRRSGEIKLLQARGGSRTGVLLRLLGEGAVTVVPAAVLGSALAVVLLPTPRWGNAVLTALVATLLAVLAFPVRASMIMSKPRAAAGRRRLVGELCVLAATAAAVAEVRRRGVAAPGAGIDPLLVLTPLLLAVTGGMVLARLQPFLVGRLSALAGRGRGVVGFLGLARAARGSTAGRRPSVLPLLALLIAVTTTGFGATVLDTVDNSRMRAARIASSGDSSVAIPTYGTLPEEFVKAAGELPGVRAATGAWVETQATFIGGDHDSTKVVLIAAEPKAYAEIARTLGVGEFDPAKLAAAPGGRDTPVPALFSRDLAKRLATGPARVHLPGGSDLRTTAAGIVSATPALAQPDQSFVVVSADAAGERIAEFKKMNKWFAVGDIDPGAVRSLLLERGVNKISGYVKMLSDEAAAAGKGAFGLPPGYTVHSSQEEAAALAADPLQRSAGRLFWYAAFASGGFALLAVLLTLVRAAPERTALLARLRTMGLRPRQGLALIITETLPQTLTAAVGGGLVALAAVGLIGSAINLSALVGARVDDELLPSPAPVLLPTAGLALVVCLAVVLETAISGRRQIATELRAGESP
ncbi:hypothetical protein ACIBCA_18560 [Kitasatospora sp. NPDC051170]|uniref:hypothetical protein n=1 Tax=Kitasatospora sp. NPDC051170 TaxID=3364056 RepID=UPI0037B1E288